MASPVRPKKHLGQHFLKDHDVAIRTAEALPERAWGTIVEVGPGTGMLTQYLSPRFGALLTLAEVDVESIAYLKKHPEITKGATLLHQDFLQMNLGQLAGPLAVVGNFPYNISSQIIFHSLESGVHVEALVGMFQKEVAMRIASGPGTKDYGILSVLVQAFFDAEYLFTVAAEAFEPPPKVESGILRLVRRETPALPIEEYKRLKLVVKTAFNQRRKVLSNALKSILNGAEMDEGIAGKRAEQLSVDQFVALTRSIYPSEA
jgi:16S rRNA (adenine1518-N6/adenine1519-N6)-dimethyltransferase